MATKKEEREFEKERKAAIKARPTRMKEEGISFEEALKDIVKETDNYKHDFIDNNAASHIRAFLLGSSETIPIVDGRLDLGTWQSIFFVELEGPRSNRTVELTFIGE